MKKLYFLFSLLITINVNGQLMFISQAGRGVDNTVYPLYGISGQSNADGRAAINSITNTALKTVMPDAFIYGDMTSSAIQPITPYVNNCIGMTPGTSFGPELTLGYYSAKSHKKSYIVKQALGGMAISYWKRPNGGGYKLLCTYFNNAINVLNKAKIYVELKGFLWMQGENDATDTTLAITYYANLDTFLTTFKAYLVNLAATYPYFTINSNFKFTIARINGYYDASERFRDIVRAAEVQYATDHPTTTQWMDTDIYPNGGTVHYDYIGQQNFGIDFLNLCPY
jgi:hypothetical protein